MFDSRELERWQRIAVEKGLPLHDAINVHDSLDEQSAARRFLGRTLAEVEDMCRENLLGLSEDFMVMGPQAFCFYLDAAISYLKSESATGDSDGVNGLVGAVSHRIEWRATEIAPARRRLAELCDYLLGHLDRYDLIPGIYDDLPGTLSELRESLAEE